MPVARETNSEEGAAACNAEDVIREVTGVRNLQSVQKIEVYGQPVADLSGLRKCSKLAELSMIANGLKVSRTRVVSAGLCRTARGCSISLRAPHFRISAKHSSFSHQ